MEIWHNVETFEEGLNSLIFPMGGAFGAVVILVGNEYSEPGSNPERGYLYFT